MNDDRRPSITRREARLIAEELFKLQQKAKAETPEPPEELLGMRAAAKYLNRSYNYLQRNEGGIPRIKKGGRYFYVKSQLAKYLYGGG